MATNKELQAEVKRLKEELQRNQEAMTKASKTGIVSPIVEGLFTVTGEDPKTGEEASRKFRFKAGRIRVPLTSGQQVPSAALIRIANGGEATKEEKANRPWLLEVTQEIAQARLEWLVEKASSMIEEVKAEPAPADSKS